MPRFEIVSVPVDQMEELQPVWRSLYEHHLALTPHLSDRAQPFEHAWRARQRIEAEWQARGEELFVLAAEAEDRYIGLCLRACSLRHRLRGVLGCFGAAG